MLPNIPEMLASQVLQNSPQLATSKLHTRIKLLHLSTAPHFLEHSHRLPLWGVIIRKHLCLSKENKIYGALKETEPDTGEKSQASGRNAATALS